MGETKPKAGEGKSIRFLSKPKRFSDFPDELPGRLVPKPEPPPPPPPPAPFIMTTGDPSPPKGQLISECLFEKIVWTKIPTKNLIDSAQQV